MSHEELVNNVAKEVEERLSGESSGHDWWHIYRVWQSAKRIGEEESADMVVVELAALLHDIADWKLHDGDEAVGPRIAGEILTAHNVSPERIEHVQKIIKESGFKGNHQTPSTLEGKVVQDADRLDALGAIGIARCFAYGGHKGRALHDPTIDSTMAVTKDEYRTRATPSIHHFYEKLLLLKDFMNTESAKRMAEERHAFLETFLDRFYKEWEGEL